VVAYDRRGFGRSSKPAFGYDFDTLASDLHALMTTLELRDVALAGFGMGAGDVARYCSRHGSKGVRSVTFVSGITPATCPKPENPDGIDASDVDRVQREIDADRYAFSARFIATAYDTGEPLRHRVSDELLARDAAVAAEASPFALRDAVHAWREDFGPDLDLIDVPTLIVHGDSDRVVPLAVTTRRLLAHVQHPTLKVIEGAPHALFWTHASSVNTAMLGFLR
jgi:peroxiredoxin